MIGDFSEMLIMLETNCNSNRGIPLAFSQRKGKKKKKKKAHFSTSCRKQKALSSPKQQCEPQSHQASAPCHIPTALPVSPAAPAWEGAASAAPGGWRQSLAAALAARKGHGSIQKEQDQVDQWLLADIH